MSTSLVLFTGFQLLGLGLMCYLVYEANQSAKKAGHSEHRLAIMRGQVRGLELAVVAIDDQQKRLAGRFNVSLRRDRDPPVEYPVGPDGTSRDVCENWQLAKQEGPGSTAAACSCAYCESMRADRHRRRANLRTGVKS